MEDRALDHFGVFLASHLRDRAIEGFDLLAKGQWKAPALQALQADLADLSPAQREIARRAVIECIDGAIHDLLFALQEQADFENRITVSVDGLDVVKASDGIHGEPYGEEGWYARFSKYGPHPETA
jgi:hypothetical protein